MLEYIKSKGKVAIDAKTFEKQFKSGDGGNVKGYGRSIRRNSDTGSSKYTKDLPKKHADLRDVMRYDKKTDMYYLNGADSGDTGSSGIGGFFSDMIDEASNVVDSIPPAGDARSNILGGLAILLVIALISGGISLYRAGKVFVGKANSFLSSEYQAEIFEYEGLEYIDNQRFNKPDGPCMRLDGGSDYTIGFFEEADLDGYGLIVRDDGADLQEGTFKKSKLHGWGICRVDGVSYVGQFKKGVAKGYGYCYNSGTEQFVKFQSATAGSADFASHVEVVAQLEGDAWIKPNGKALKVKDGEYKDILWLREGLVRIGKTEYYFDPEGEAYYDGPETRLCWDVEDSMYDSILEDNEGTRLYFYFNEGLEGQHQYNKGKKLMVNSFSVDMTLN